MATGRVKGITIEIGGDATKLDKALTGVDRNLFTIQKDLQAVEKRLKLDPTNTELLAQKQRLLSEAVEATAQRMKVLDDAADGVNQAFTSMEIDDKKFRDFYLELDVTAADLKAAERALADFADGLEEVDSPADDAADAIEDVEDAADDAGGVLSDLGNFGRGAADALGLTKIASAGAAFTIGQELVQAAMDAVKWMVNLDEATEDYREAMGKVDTAFEVAGYSPEEAMEAYRGFYAILGDTDTAAEASQLLAQLANDGQEVSRWIKAAAGVYGTFGDALPIEGLIEAANETAKVGKVTGVLADALNWVGINEDDFNKLLEDNIDAGNRANLIMETLARTYGDAADAFYENNEAITASREAQAEMDETMAELGEAVSNVKTALLEAFGPDLVNMVKDAASAINMIADAIEKIGDALEPLRGNKDMQKALDFAGIFGGLTGGGIGGILSGGSSRAAAAAYFDPFDSASFAVTTDDLPHLAQGTVARPNSPFLAVVGDNIQEPEIVSPYSTIRQAVDDALAERGGMSGNMRVTVSFPGSVGQLIRQLQPQIAVETDRLGPNFVK